LTDEAGEREYTKIKVRIAPESFSDIIFGLALSIGSLILIQSQVLTWQDVAWNVLLFGFSFLVIAMTWLLFSRTISVLLVEVPSALFLNLVLLFCVALEPYLFYLLMSGATQYLLSFTSIGYALDVGIMYVILATLASLVLKQERTGRIGQRSKLHPMVLKRFRHMMVSEYVVGALFLVSAVPVFWVPTQIGHLRFVLWYSSFLIFFASHMLARRSESKKK
jgi:uncharacterized membrane protein